MNFQAPRIVVRGAGSGAGFAPFAVGGALCDGAAVIGPDGACASVSSAASSPSAANPLSTVSLKKQPVFIFDPNFIKLPFMYSPHERKEFPLREVRNS